MISKGEIYKDVIGRIFKINGVTDNYVTVNVLEGQSFGSNPIPISTAKSYIDADFWWSIEQHHIETISQNYCI